MNRAQRAAAAAERRERGEDRHAWRHRELNPLRKQAVRFFFGGERDARKHVTGPPGGYVVEPSGTIYAVEKGGAYRAVTGTELVVAKRLFAKEVLGAKAKMAARSATPA